MNKNESHINEVEFSSGTSNDTDNDDDGDDKSKYTNSFYNSRGLEAHLIWKTANTMGLIITASAIITTKLIVVTAVSNNININPSIALTVTTVISSLTIITSSIITIMLTATMATALKSKFSKTFDVATIIAHLKLLIRIVLNCKHLRNKKWNLSINILKFEVKCGMNCF